MHITLEEGNYILSEDPYYFQNESGRMIGLNPRFTQFMIYNNEDELIEEIALTWNNKCESTVLREPIEEIYGVNESANFSKYYFVVIIIGIGILVLLIYNWRKKLCQKKC